MTDQKGLPIMTLPPEITKKILHLPDVTDNMSRMRQYNWLNLSLVKMELLSSRVREINRTVAFMKELSPDLTVLSIQPGVNDVSFEKKAWRSIITPLFLKGFTMSSHGAKKLYYEYYPNDGDYFSDHEWWGGEMPDIQTQINRFHIMRSYHTFVIDVQNDQFYLNLTSKILWFANKILSYHDKDFLTIEVKMLQRAIQSLERLIRKDYDGAYGGDDWMEQKKLKDDLAACNRYHELMITCKNKEEEDNLKFEGNTVYCWTNCRTEDERAWWEESADEGNEDSADEDNSD